MIHLGAIPKVFQRRIRNILVRILLFGRNILIEQLTRLSLLATTANSKIMILVFQLHSRHVA
jgi:hypothetical protein